MPRTGTVENIETRETQNGGQFLRVQIDGLWGSVFESVPDGLVPGAEVQYERVNKSSGDREFVNFQNIEVINGFDETEPDKGLSRSERIKYQWAVKVAAELHGDTSDVTGLFDLAETIVEEAENRWEL